MSRTTKVWITCSPKGDYLANVIFPRHPGDSCHGWHQARRPTPQDAANWIADVLRNHLTKRANFMAAKRQKRLAAQVPSAEGAG